MEYQIIESGPTLTGEDIAAWEQRTSQRVPEPYREFLMVHNGGYPDPADFTIEGKEGEPDMVGAVDRFLGVGVAEYGSLDYYLHVYQDRLPSDFFPIASDPGGNIICMGTSREDAGKIFFWDHEEESEEGEPPTRKNSYFVADSLDALLRSLR